MKAFLLLSAFLPAVLYGEQFFFSPTGKGINSFDFEYYDFENNPDQIGYGLDASDSTLMTNGVLDGQDYMLNPTDDPMKPVWGEQTSDTKGLTGTFAATSINPGSGAAYVLVTRVELVIRGCWGTANGYATFSYDAVDGSTQTLSTTIDRQQPLTYISADIPAAGIPVSKDSGKGVTFDLQAACYTEGGMYVNEYIVEGTVIATPTPTETPTTDPTKAPTTASPTTKSPTSAAPTSASPTSAAPTSAPTSVAPTSASPTSAAPTSASPTSVAPTSAAPTSRSPTSSQPTRSPTLSPTTECKGEITWGDPHYYLASNDMKKARMFNFQDVGEFYYVYPCDKADVDEWPFFLSAYQMRCYWQGNPMSCIQYNVLYINTKPKAWIIEFTQDYVQVRQLGTDAVYKTVSEVEAKIGYSAQMYWG